MKQLLTSCFLLLLMLRAQAQEPRQQRWVFGLQFKPIVPSDITRTRQETFITNDITYTNRQRPGYAFGMYLRQSFNKRLAIETGINYVVRNYRTSNALVSYNLAYMEDHDLSPREVAQRFLRKRQELWRQWVPAEVADRVVQRLPTRP